MLSSFLRKKSPFFVVCSSFLHQWIYTSRYGFNNHFLLNVHQPLWCDLSIKFDPHRPKDGPAYGPVYGPAIPRWIKEIPDHLKTQKMCIEAVRMEPPPWYVALITLRHKRFAMRQWTTTHMQQIMSLITLRRKRCATS